jgi:hypothetical protein
MTAQRSKDAYRPIREDEAEKIVAGVKDPVARNVVTLCLTRARMRFMRWQGTTEDEWKAQLPTADLDMAFLASVLEEVFSKRDVVDRILRGESIASATDWDV